MNAHFQNAIYDTAKLVLSPDETRVRGKSEPESDEDAKFRRIALRRGIEKAIADPDAYADLTLYLSRVLVHPRPPRVEVWLPDDRVAAVMREGLDVLGPDEIDILALSPNQMSQLQLAVHDCGPELTPGWVDAFERAWAEQPGPPRRSLNDIVDAAFAAAGLERPSRA